MLVIAGGPSRVADLHALPGVPARVLSANEHGFLSPVRYRPHACVAVDTYHTRRKQPMHRALERYRVPVLMDFPWTFPDAGMCAIAVAALWCRGAPVWVAGFELSGACRGHRRELPRLLEQLGAAAAHVQPLSGPFRDYFRGA